jgi:hypothetical protein
MGEIRLNYIEEIKKTFNLMEIKNAIIIDDDLNIKDKHKELVYDILEGKHDDEEEFSIQDELSNLDLQYDEVISGLAEDVFPPELFLKLKENFPELFKTKVDILISVIDEIFEGKITLKDKALNDKELSSITKETIVFLDYQLEGSPLESYELTRLLSKQDQENPLLIVFISTNEEFYLGKEGQPFKMEVLSDRNKYFRGLRTLQLTSEYKNSLYEYINKGKLNLKETTLKSLFEISQNLYGGQRFFKLLDQIEEVLIKSSEEVLGKFHLLNSRSIQELLVEKVALEGESESAFLLNWISRNISKSVTKIDTLTHNIHTTLEEIGQWSTPFNELHEDEALKEIVRDEMWENINSRHVPIEFGDVFEIMYNNEKYKAILITQPCTIAVRGDGSRSGELATLILEEKKKKIGDSLAIIEDWDGNILIFDLNTTISIPFEVLDLTTLDKEGIAKLVFEVKPDGKLIELPEKALWSKGYTKMMNKLTSRLLTEINDTKELHTFGYMWIPFSLKGNSYEFPIVRMRRLDTYYSLFVLQKLQAWSGRIGLPLDVKFMNDYEKKMGKVHINGILKEAELYIKQSTNDGVKDIAISVEILESLLIDVYKENSTFIEILQNVFKSTELLKYNYSSGERLVSLVKSTDAINLLGKQNIHINVQKDDLFIGITVCEFTKCFFNGEDVTDLFSDFKLDPRGYLRYHLQTTLLEKLNLETQIPHYDKKVEDKGEGVKILKMDSKLNLFKHKILGDTLVVVYEGEAAAAIE